jgi:amino acid transporter
MLPRRVSRVTAKATQPVFWLLVLLFYMLIVNPQRVPVFALIVPFVLMGLCLYTTCLVLIGSIPRAVSPPKANHRAVSALLSGVAVCAVGLQSIGQFTLRDFGVLLLLAGVAYLYVARNILGIR